MGKSTRTTVGAVLALTLSTPLYSAPDGDYNEINPVFHTWAGSFDGVFTGSVIISKGGAEASESVVGFDGSDSSFHYNDGIGGGTEEWRFENESQYFIDGTGGQFGHWLETSHESPDEDSVTGSYTATGNLLELAIQFSHNEGSGNALLNGIHTPGTDADLVIGMDHFEFNTGTQPCNGCTQDGQPVEVNITEEAVDIQSNVYLKKGQTQLTLADISGQYAVQIRGSEIRCVEGDDDGNASDYQETCTTFGGSESLAVQEFDLIEALVTFNGAGSCTFNYLKEWTRATEHIGQRPTDYFNYVDVATGTADIASCSYTVSGVDNLRITLTDVDPQEDDDVIDLKVSSTKRYLAGGEGVFTTNLPTPAGQNWFSNRGFVRGMKVNQDPASASHAGTYLGSYQKAVSHDECMLASDAPCANDRQVTTLVMAKVAVTLDGAGNCTWKELYHEGTLHLLHDDYSGAYHTTDVQTNDLTCSYTVNGGLAQNILFTVDGQELSAFLSDDTNTVLIQTGIANNTATNNATNNPTAADFGLDEFPLIAKESGCFAGIAIKYDGVISQTVIDKWLKNLVILDNNSDDFNGDAKSDILVRRTSDGYLFMYEMDGNSRTGKNIGGLSTDWTVQGIGDFNGDGKNDILVRRTSDGYLFMYEMNGNVRTGKSIGGLSTDWTVQGLGDFNGDGKDDILIRRTSDGYLFMYEMNGNVRTGKNIGGMSTDWTVQGLGDFNGDGKDDILIRRTSDGYLFMYEMNGNVRTGKNIGGMSTDWTVQGLGDFNGDGKADILIRRTSDGYLFMYEMNGNVRTGKSIGGMDNAWAIERIADYGGDGKADILIRRTSDGYLMMYEMNANVRTSKNVGSLSTSWEVEVQ